MLAVLALLATPVDRLHDAVRAEAGKLFKVKELILSRWEHAGRHRDACWNMVYNLYRDLAHLEQLVIAPGLNTMMIGYLTRAAMFAAGSTRRSKDVRIDCRLRQVLPPFVPWEKRARALMCKWANCVDQEASYYRRGVSTTLMTRTSWFRTWLKQCASALRTRLNWAQA